MQLQAPDLVTSLGSLLLSKDGVWRSFQGEGPRTGRITTFLRLAACNLTCSWCDTEYTWNWKRWPKELEALPTPFIEVARLLQRPEVQTGSLTITGGEPLLQWRQLGKFFEHYPGVAEEVNFETNGTIFPNWDSELKYIVDMNYVVSPKLRNSGDQYAKQNLESLRKFGQVGADFKFVCENVQDLDEVEEFLTMISFQGYTVPKYKVWIMPQGVEPGLVVHRATMMAEEVLKRGWNLTTRLHIQLWGNSRAH